MKTENKSIIGLKGLSELLKIRYSIIPAIYLLLCSLVSTVFGQAGAQNAVYLGDRFKGAALFAQL